MLNAKWGGVMVFRGRETDLYQAPQPEIRWTLPRRAPLSASPAKAGVKSRSRPLSADPALAGLTKNSRAAAIFVPITASDDESLGSLCLLRDRKQAGRIERRLLHALASHAALSLENFRRFSQLERSKRQWVEDIDAISDYIVVHDRSLAVSCAPIAPWLRTSACRL